MEKTKTGGKKYDDGVESPQPPLRERHTAVEAGVPITRARRKTVNLFPFRYFGAQSSPGDLRLVADRSKIAVELQPRE